MMQCCLNPFSVLFFRELCYLADALQFGYGRCTTTCSCPCYEVVWRHDTRHSSVACFPRLDWTGSAVLLSRCPVWSCGPLACAATPRVKPRRASLLSDGHNSNDSHSLPVCLRQKASCRQVVSLKRYVYKVLGSNPSKSNFFLPFSKVYYKSVQTQKGVFPYKEVHKEKNCFGGKKCFHEVFIAFFRGKN